ncbi:MAG: hypothetical protein LBG96_05710 [Tannerella sp.]|nr:hypothetical protein [Tannerella sp.]
MTISEVAARIELQVRGWINYYGKYCASDLKSFLEEINRGIARWACRKYKRFRGNRWKTLYWSGRLAKRDKIMFYHWELGITPPISHKG